GLRLRRPRMEGRSSPPHENRPPRRSSSTSDVEQRLARLAGEALGLSAVMIARRQGDTAVVAAAWPLRGEDAEVPVAERLVGGAMRSGAVLATPPGELGWLAAVAPEGARACVVAPIIGSSDREEALIALSDQADRSWAPHELRLMEALARLVAI